MKRSRRCARPGCRAWAMRGAEYCWAHRSMAEVPVAAEPDREGYRELLDGRITELLRQASAPGRTGGESLAEEISALRLVLGRLLAEEDDPARLATSIPRVVDTVVRAVRTQRTISGTMAEDLTEALTQVLMELGLGDHDGG